MTLLLLSVEPITSVLSEFRTDALATVLAISAIYLNLGKEGIRENMMRLMAGIFLSGLSIMIMPKYSYVLAFFFLARLAVDWKNITPRNHLLPFFGVVLFTFIFLCALSSSIGANMLDTLKWSHLLMLKYYQHVAKTVGTIQDPGLCSLADIFKDYPIQATFFSAFVLLALIFTNSNTKRILLLSLLFGMSFSAFKSCMPFRQYLTPVICPAIFFVPEASAFFRVKNNKAYEWCASVVCLFIILASLALFLKSSRTAATSRLYLQCFLEDNLSGRTNPAGSSLAVTTPLFRRPLMFLTWNEDWGAPPGWLPLLGEDEQIRSEFSGKKLAEVLQSSKPVFIQVSRNLPSGWLPEIQKFLQQNHPLYERLVWNGNEAFLLKSP